MLNKVEIDELQNKINLIKKNEAESCKYLVNVFNTYKKIIYENVKVNDINTSLKYNLKFINNITELPKIANEADDIVIISFEDKNENIEFYNNLLNEYNKLLILVITNNTNLKTSNNRLEFVNFNKNNIINKLKSYIVKNIIFHIDIDLIDTGNDWEIKLIKNFENILKKFNSYNINEINNNQKQISSESIIVNEKKIHYGFSLKIIKKDMSVKTIIYILRYLTEMKKSVEIVINIGNSLDYIKKINIDELITAINISQINDKRKRVEYIYDNLCDRIQNDLAKYKYCDFKDNKCLAQRDIDNNSNYPINELNGCCYIIEKKQECNRLKEKNCETKCISCRLFICGYLKQRGISYEIQDNLQIRLFLNFMQKPVLVWNFFKTKEDIINEMLKW